MSIAWPVRWRLFIVLDAPDATSVFCRAVVRSPSSTVKSSGLRDSASVMTATKSGWTPFMRSRLR